VGHGERRRELERQFPGWEIWYVPREPDSATWCARPQMLINADSPEDLAAAIRAAHSGSAWSAWRQVGEHGACQGPAW